MPSHKPFWCDFDDWICCGNCDAKLNFAILAQQDEENDSSIYCNECQERVNRKALVRVMKKHFTKFHMEWAKICDVLGLDVERGCSEPLNSNDEVKKLDLIFPGCGPAWDMRLASLWTNFYFKVEYWRNPELGPKLVAFKLNENGSIDTAGTGRLLNRFPIKAYYSDERWVVIR